MELSAKTNLKLALRVKHIAQDEYETGTGQDRTQELRLRIRYDRSDLIRSDLPNDPIECDSCNQLWPWAVSASSAVGRSDATATDLKVGRRAETRVSRMAPARRASSAQDTSHRSSAYHYCSARRRRLSSPLLFSPLLLSSLRASDSPPIHHHRSSLAYALA